MGRTELGGDPHALAGPGSNVLLRLLHLTDLHVMDAASPARAEWVEARADDPLWKPLLHLHRPYEALANSGVAAMVASIATWTRDPIDLAIVTGDCIDNAQANEFGAYLTLMDGGAFAFPYAGPLEPSWRAALSGARPWPFWCPVDDGPDVWKDGYGFPVVPDLLDAVSSTVRSPGVGIPWLGVLGNHDVMRQGTAWSTPALETIATGTWKHAALPVWPSTIRCRTTSCGPRTSAVDYPDLRSRPMRTGARSPPRNSYVHIGIADAASPLGQRRHGATTSSIPNAKSA